MSNPHVGNIQPQLDLEEHDHDLTAKRVSIANSLVPEKYDYISLSYTGANLTGVIYKLGGSGGTIVATLTLAYTGSVLDTITRS